jgi:hypothetical protein
MKRSSTRRGVFTTLLAFSLLIPLVAAAQTAGSFGTQVVRQPAPLLGEDGSAIGLAEFWNTRNNFIVELSTEDEWMFTDIQIYAGPLDFDAVPMKKDKPSYSNFPCKREIDGQRDRVMVSCSLEEEFDHRWGGDQTRLVVIHGDLVKLNEAGEVIAENDFYALPEASTEFANSPITVGPLGNQAYFTTTFVHPRRGHFIDSPVGGLTFDTPTHWGTTDESGGFDHFPGERVELAVGPVALGTPLADHRISPLDIYPGADTDDARVINMARLLQSLDVDANTSEGIAITDDVIECLDEAYETLGLTSVDFASDTQVEALIEGTISACETVDGVTLEAVSAEDAKAHLDKVLDSSMFRKNVSRSPDLTSSKSKLNVMGVWFPALRANGDPFTFLNEGVVTAGIPYYDEDGDLIRTASEAKPVVVVYTDGVEETGSEDIFAAISRDDGNTFKRKNLSRAADRSSFTLEDGTEFFGQAKKPVFQVKGNNILVAWTSKFCRGGRPAYAIEVCEEGDTECAAEDYVYDDPYYTDDIWGVAGPQRSVDYTDQGFPEVGEVPYSCVWTARGTIVTQGMINSGGFWVDPEAPADDPKFTVGDIVWFKPERLTSGRRDANQVFLGASDGAGFAIAWQEDPKGLRPGDAAGPGPGWGGATTNHKTDIWYSYITVPDFRKVDANFVSGGDPEHDLDVVERPKALVPMSLPVRLSDNDTVNTENLMVELGGDGYPVGDGPDNWIPITNPDTDGEGDGTHAYGYEIDGLCEGFYEFTNYQDELKRVCITEDGRLLDGDTGASRPNLFLQTYTKSDDTKSAWAILSYEETKGAGLGPPDHDGEGPYGDEPVPEEGKNVIYHSFDFQNPDEVSAGSIVNLPERDADGNLVYLREVSVDADGNVVYGDLIVDYLGQPQLAYENARRPRFIIQGKAAIGTSKTVMLVLYKQGEEGMGRPSDIMLRRFVANAPGNPYAFGNIVCNAWETADNGVQVCADPASVQNMSTVNPTVVTDSMGEPTSDDPYGAVKVIEWEQTPELLANASWVNPYEDARAHRGALRGDFVVMGYSYTPNWAAARNGHDKYDLYVRRSFDGGLTWSTDPAGSGVEHCKTWTEPSGTQSPGTKTEVCTFYAAGAFEEAHNLSQLPNNKTSVIEPRIVGAPGTIKVNGDWTGIAEDKQNKNLFYVSYGTATNPPTVHGDSDEVQEYPAPLDLYYSFSQDRGESFVEVEWDVNPDSDGNYAGETVSRWDYLAKGDPEQGEAQLRMTPDGSRFYATWLQEGDEGSDIWFRRIMSPAFPSNIAPEPTE